MYKSYFSKFLGASTVLIVSYSNSFSQIVGGGYDISGRQKEIITNIETSVRPVQTAVPFLSISPNARAAGMGDQGVATSADENSAYWNPGKLCKVNGDFGVGVSYNPWLRTLVNDMSLSYLSGYYRLRKEDVIGINMTYFDLGTINFTNDVGGSIGDYNPREFAFSGTYSRMLSKKFSAGISLKYINSNLTGNVSAGSSGPSSPGQTGAADIGFYYNTDLFLFDKDMHLTVGAAISNIGGKISYGNNGRADFIPTIMRLGAVHTTELDDFNKISLGVEASKLMTPSSTIQYNYTYEKKKNNIGGAVGSDSLTKVDGFLTTPNKTLIGGILGSFGDAPLGAKEEFQEIMLSFSAEYWYDNMFAVRAGYFFEDKYKGNRNYFSAGLGIKYKTVGLDFAYLIPTTYNNPLANTVRFSLSFNFEKPKEKEQESVVE